MHVHAEVASRAGAAVAADDEDLLLRLAVLLVAHACRLAVLRFGPCRQQRVTGPVVDAVPAIAVTGRLHIRTRSRVGDLITRHHALTDPFGSKARLLGALAETRVRIVRLGDFCDLTHGTYAPSTSSGRRWPHSQKNSKPCARRHSRV